MKHNVWSRLLAFGLATTLVLNFAAPAFAYQGAKEPDRIKSKSSSKKKKGTIEIKNDTGKECNDLHIYWRPTFPTIEGIKVKETGKDPFPSGYIPDDSKADSVTNHGKGKGDGTVKAGDTVEVKIAWDKDDMPEIAGYAWTLDGAIQARSKDHPKAQIIEVKGKAADDTRKSREEAAKKAAEQAKKDAEEKAKKDAKKDAKKNRGTQRSVAPSGLREETFDTVEGTVRVLMPDDMRPGEIITGTVIAEPNGATAAEREANMDELTGLVMEIGEQKVEVRDRKFNWTIPAAGLMTYLLFKPDGTPLRARSGQIEIPKPGPDPDPVGGPGFSIPTHGQTGKPMPISGNFDPNTPTVITIGGQPAEILAESPRQAIVSLPRNLVGPQDVLVSENGRRVAEGKMGLLQISLSAGKLNLLKGETTTLQVKVIGLEPIDFAGDRLEVYFDPAYVIVINDSPNVIEFMGPGSEPFEGSVFPKPKPSIGRSLRIDSSKVIDGTFEGTIQIRAKQTGAFKISTAMS